MAFSIAAQGFRIVNIIVGVLIAICGVLMFSLGFTGFMVGIYNIIFGVVFVVLEFFAHDLVQSQAPFLFTFLGRGLTYLYLGCIVMSSYDFRLIAGVIVVVIGFIYIALQFVPNVLPPNAGGWLNSSYSSNSNSTTAPVASNDNLPGP